jgi:hypothetical protein
LIKKATFGQGPGNVGKFCIHLCDKQKGLVMKVTIKTIAGLTSLAGLLIVNAAVAQVINGGFETASGAYTTGALGWSDFSTAANNGSTASAQRSLLDPFAGAAELTLAYQNSANPGIGPSVIAQSDIFPTVGGLAQTLTFEAKGVTISLFENSQVQVQWFGAGNSFLGATGFQSYQGTLNGIYSLQNKNFVAPAGTTGALIQFLTAGSANANDAGLTRIDNVSLAGVPEPTSFSLAAMGLLGIWMFRRSPKA